MTNAVLLRRARVIVSCTIGVGLLSWPPPAVAAKTASREMSANATEATPTANDGALTYDLPVDLSVTLGSGALALTLELLSSTMAPAHCRWCDRNATGQDTLNEFDASIRNALRWSNTNQANRLSNVWGYGLAPLVSAGGGSLLLWHDGRLADLPLDALVVAESVFLAMNVNQLTKLAVARERPYAHAHTAAQRDILRSSEDNLSFYSGHTSFAFSLAVATSTVASMRRYRLAPVLWVTGLAVAAATGYLRIAADRHYATDVIGGAVIGSAVGFSVPYFAHRAPSSGVRLATMPVPGGSALLVYGSW